MIGEKKGQWQWQDKDGRWRDHAGETSDKIEHVYQTRHGKGTVVVECENEKWVPAPHWGWGFLRRIQVQSYDDEHLCVLNVKITMKTFSYILVYTSFILVALGPWIIIDCGYWPGKLSGRAPDLIFLHGSQVCFLVQAYIFIVNLLILPFPLQINTLFY